MLLENELEELSHWFNQQYPDGTFSGHAGYDKRDRHEEYHITFEMNGKHFSAPPLRIPPGGENQPKEFIEKFKKDFVTVQKRKISAAALGLVYN